MGLQLRCLRDNKIWLLKKERILVQDQPASLPPSAEPKVGLLVRYPSTGWVLYDLRGRAALIHNGHRVRRCNLAAGDWLQWGGIEFAVESNNQPDPAGLLSDYPREEDDKGVATEPRRCRLTFQLGELTRTQSKNGAELVIGCWDRCDISVEKAFGLAHRQCLLALESGQWYLHDLSGKGIGRDSQLFPSLVLKDGDVVQLGKTSIIFGFDAGEPWPEPASATPCRAKVPAGNPADAPPISVPESKAAPTDPAEVDYVFQAGRKLCDWLHRAQARNRRPLSTRQTITLTYWKWRARKRFRACELLEALEIVAEGLQEDPWNRELLLTLARFFDQLDYLNLCLEVLETLHDLYPEDAGVNRALAKLCRHLNLSVRAVPVDQTAIA